MKKLATYVALLVILAATSANAALIFSQNFENDATGSMPTNKNVGFGTDPGSNVCTASQSQYCYDNAIRVRASGTGYGNAYQGNKFLATKFEPGYPAVNGHAYRSNLTLTPGGSINGVYTLPYDSIRWVGFAFRVPNPGSVSRINVMNFHMQNWGTRDGVSCGTLYPGTTKSVWSIGFIGDNYKWTGLNTTLYPWRYGINWASHGLNNMNGGDDHGDLLRTGYSQLGDGDWHRIVFKINLSRTRYGGELRVWLDGVEETRLNIPNFHVADAFLPVACGHAYAIIGSGASTLDSDGKSWTAMQVDYDSIRWGGPNSSYAEVDPLQDRNGTAPATCSQDRRDLCVTETECGLVDGYWCNDICHDTACSETVPTIDSLTCSANGMTVDCDEIPFDAENVSMSATTSIPTICRYYYTNDENESMTDKAWATMTGQFTLTGTVENPLTGHRKDMPNFSNASWFQFAVKCATPSGVASLQYPVMFKALAETGNTDPPVISGSSTVRVRYGVSRQEDTINTDVDAECRYSDTPGQDFDDMTAMPATDAGHHYYAEDLGMYAKTVYKKCKGQNGVVSDDFATTFLPTGLSSGR